jgi:HlyD family secretion protein
MGNMDKNDNEEIEIRNEDFQEVLGAVPPWILRWGIFTIALIFVLLLMGSVVLKYPDTISANITLTRTVPDAAVLCRSGGKIMQLLVQDKRHVKKGAYLAVIENSTKTADIIYLKSYLDGLKDEANSILTMPPRDLTLGDMQSLYASFYLTLSDYRQFKRLRYYLKKNDFIRDRDKKNTDYYRNIARQKELVQKQMRVAHHKYSRDSLLNKEGLISNEEEEESYSAYLQSRLSFANMDASLGNQQLQMMQTKESLFDTEYQYEDKKNTLRTQLKAYISQLKTGIHAWELSYVLVSPIDGTVTFTKYWANNQNINSGDVAFNVISSAHGQMLGKASLPVTRSGKVYVGQKVNINFKNYPENEYGIVRGFVKNISLVSVTGDDKTKSYIIDISMPHGLRTTYNKELPYRPEMEGEADIITNDISFLERLLLPLKKIWTES